MHSPGWDIFEVMPGLCFPYTQPIIVLLDDATSYDPENEAYIPPNPNNSSSINLTTSRNEDDKLTYPFDDSMLDQQLPTPGPIIQSTQLLEHLMPGVSPEPTLPANVEDLMREIFRSNSREASRSPFTDSRVVLPQWDHLWGLRWTPYSINNLSHMIQMVSMPSSDEDSESSVLVSANSMPPLIEVDNSLDPSRASSSDTPSSSTFSSNTSPSPYNHDEEPT